MPRIDRRLAAHFEWPLLLLFLLILGAGLATILSATYSAATPISSVFLRQLGWFGLGSIALILTMSVDYHVIDRYGYLLYGAVILLLVAVLLTGKDGGGAYRWLAFGPVRLQPSELMKVALAVALARQLHRKSGDSALPYRVLLGSAVLIGVPMYLVLIQPDLGTAIALGLGAFTVLLVAGFPLRLIVIGAALLSVSGPYVWKHLKPYQKERVETYLHPGRDPRGTGYHIIQSKVAIGSGMLRGKGYLKGTQNHLNFLPEQHTDFIFSVYAEEWGFLGSITLLLLYAALALRGMTIAIHARDALGALLAAGLTGTIFCQAAINIGMTMGSLPVVGITLPFFSYGGSSLVALMATVGLLMNVSMRRYTF